MSYQIEVTVESGLPDLDPRAIERAVLVVLRQQSVPAGELAVVVGDNDLLHDLNRRFLAIDKPTDVLSFPSGEAIWETLPDGQTPYLGDIAIAAPIALAQAEAAGHALPAELQLLAVHATLHLLGFDHGDAEEKASMWAAQQAALDELGLGAVAPT